MDERGKIRGVEKLREPKRPIYGLTGVVGKDGVLTLEKQQRLDSLQSQTAVGAMDHLSRRKPEDNFPLVHMATGIGKGKIIHMAIEKQRKLKPDSRILVIVGTKNVLLGQTHDALAGYQTGSVTNGNGAFVESEDSDDENLEIDESELERDEFKGYTVGKYGQRKAKVDVELATIQMVASQSKAGKLIHKNYDLTIIDEVHNAGTQQKVDAIKRFNRVVGFTATPYRHSGKLKDPSQYGFEVVTSYLLPEAQEEELLPPIYGLQLNTSELVDKVPTTLTGTIDFKALEKILKDSPELRPYIVDKLVPLITLDGNHYKTVIAVNFVWEAQEIARLLKDKGIKVGVAINQQAAKQIDSPEIPALDAIERYSLPEDDPKSIQVLISPYVASEGFDAPWTEFLVWASPTDSPLRYTQYTGRLGRRNNGKAYGVVIDCLYQTSQFGWTYNFGMWMKGYVRELEDGVLYLGPMRLIPDMSAIQRMHALTDPSGLQDLQRGELLPLQDTDFALSVDHFREVFQGDYGKKDSKFRILADNVLNELRKKPEMFVKRISVNMPVEAFIDRAFLIQEMLKAGARLKEIDLKEVQITDFVLNGRSIQKSFVGSYVDKNAKLRHIADEVIESLRKEKPELFVKRWTGSKHQQVEVFTDNFFFVQEMIKGGAVLIERKTSEEIKKLGPEEFALTQSSFQEVFKGHYKKNEKLERLAANAIRNLRKKKHNLFVKRISGSHIVDAYINRSLLIEEMLKAGAELKKK